MAEGIHLGIHLIRIMQDDGFDGFGHHRRGKLQLPLMGKYQMFKLKSQIRRKALNCSNLFVDQLIPGNYMSH